MNHLNHLTQEMWPLFKAFVVLVLGIGIGALFYWVVSKIWGVSAARLKDEAVKDAERIREDASKDADRVIREAKIASKAELLKFREEAEKEIKDRRNELNSIEKRLVQREDNIEKKAESLDTKAAGLSRTENELTTIRERLLNREAELKKEISRQVSELERIAQMDQSHAKEMLLDKIRGDVQNEAGHIIRNIVDEAKEKAERESKKIMIYAMQRYASDCVYEHTTATIPLPNDEMKGRIIGRDGRNIRAIEAATGVNLLIDDTPEAVVISCFDPVKKEIARQILERLISDGRIHPTRIEELAKKVEKEVNDEIFQIGEAAVLEVGISGVPPQLTKLLGRLKYRFSYSQNVLKHCIETANFMGVIAGELKLDVKKAKRIGLFHDIGKAADHEIEGPHASIGADIMKKFGEAKDVVNAVAAHHEEAEAETVYATLASACDALSASRPGARSETADLYLKRIEQLEDISCSFQGVESCYALQAGREIRVIVQPDKITDLAAVTLARDICLKIEKEMNYPGQIKVSVIRETRTVDYAK